MNVQDLLSVVENKRAIFRHWVTPHPVGYSTSWTIYVDTNVPWFKLDGPVLVELTDINVFQFSDVHQDSLREIGDPDLKNARFRAMTTSELDFLLNHRLIMGLIPTYFRSDISTASSRMGLQTWGIEASLSIEWTNNFDHERWLSILVWAYQSREYLSSLLDQVEKSID